MNTRAYAFLGLALAALATPAAAQEIPPFLADGGKYATDATSCAAEIEEAEGYQLTAKGLYAYEFSCTFTSFQSVRYNDGDNEPDEYIAIASCGDDSGISRPDMILLMPSDENMLFLTSQNDYAISSVWEKDGESGLKWLVQREFKRCGK